MRIGDNGVATAMMRAVKRLYNETWAGNVPEAVLLRESVLQTELIGKPNQIAAVMGGFLEESRFSADPAYREWDALHHTVDPSAPVTG